jgi:glucokinase
MSRNDVLLAGLDIGGTKIGLSLGTADGRVLASDRLATDPRRGASDLLGEAWQRLVAMAEATSLGLPAAVGVAAPGPLSYREGRLLEVPNMPLWQHFPLQAWLDDHLACPAAFMNDANAGVLAEVLWGAAQDADTAVFLTMSTGMGAGLWIGGRVHEGVQALAGEVGHVRLAEDGPVGFGKRGSVEGFCSGPGLVQLAAAERTRLEQLGVPTRLAAFESLTAEDICHLAADGDAGARTAVDRSARALGRLCALLVDLLNPDVIVLGTIGTAWFELFEPVARRVLDEEALARAAAHVAIRPSGLPARGDQTALAVAARCLGGCD